MAGIKILGTGRALPQRVVTNEDYANFVDTSDEWIHTRTGMKQRHVADSETVWQLGAEAAKIALRQADIPPESIDLIIVTTATPDFYFPSTACIIQGEIGAVNAFAFDISAACSGFAFGMDIAFRYLQGGNVTRALIVCSETITQVLDYTDRSTCVLFGDGAGACVVALDETATYGSFLHSDASGAKFIYAKHNRRKLPFFADGEAEEVLPFAVDSHTGLVMNGREVYKFATKIMPQAVETACERAGVALADLALLIPHQANRRIIDTAIKNLGIPADKCLINIETYGNTSSASIAMGLDEAVRGGRVERGDLVCVVGFGAGLTYGACVFEY